MSEIKYTYDKLNRLVETIYPDGLRTRYTYDPAGNRTATNVLQPGEAPVAAAPVAQPHLPAIPPLPQAPTYVPPRAGGGRKSRLVYVFGIASLLFLCLCLGLSGLAAYFFMMSG